jgi:hypothetical protein
MALELRTRRGIYYILQKFNPLRPYSTFEAGTIFDAYAAPVTGPTLESSHISDRQHSLYPNSLLSQIISALSFQINRKYHSSLFTDSKKHGYSF